MSECVSTSWREEKSGKGREVRGKSYVVNVLSCVCVCVHSNTLGASVLSGSIKEYKNQEKEEEEEEEDEKEQE